LSKKSEIGPYRSLSGRGELEQSRFVCLGCFRSLSAFSGVCRHCEIERRPLSDPQVREDLRAEAERRLQKRMYAEYFQLSLLGFLVTLPVVFLFIPPPFGQLLWMASGITAAAFIVKSYSRLRPHSALGVFAARRQRLALPAADKKRGEDDPEDFDLSQVLDWLGAKLDD
jgi:hypothetical protein